MDTTRFLIIACSTLVTASLPAAEALRGAAAVLEELASKSGSSVQTTTKPPSETVRFRSDLSNFTARAATLLPANAATEWLKLAERFSELPPRQRFVPGEEPTQPVQFTEVIAALPPPASWDDLVKAIQAQPAPTGVKDARIASLRMLGSALAGDRAGLAAQVTAFEELLLKTKREEAMVLVDASRSLNEALLALSDDPKAIVAGVERQLTAVERDRDSGWSSINLPDLVGVVGEATATPLVERAVKSKARNFYIQGKATEALARRLALQAVNDLQVPRWELVNSLDAVALYEALEKKFSPSKPAAPATTAEAIADLEEERNDPHAKGQAQTYYLMGLIVQGRAADATRFAGQLKTQPGYQFQIAASEAALARAGFIRQLDDFLYELLSKNPELPFWEPYFSAAAQVGTTGRMLTLARATAARPELSGNMKGNLRENLYRALLAADQIEEGVKELRALIASAPKAEARARQGYRGGMMMSHQLDWQQPALTLAQLGLALDRPEWLDEGLAAAMPKSNAAADESDPLGGNLHSLVAILIQAGRHAEAEKLLIARLVKSVQAADPGYGGNWNPSAQPLQMLVELYHRAGRHADVLLLLEKSPNWGVKDLAHYFNSRSSDFGFESMLSGGKGGQSIPLATAAAAALVNAGRNAEARAIVDAMLDRGGGDDRAYELLVQLAGQDAISRLDALFARDQFEERPLIWKASLLQQAGKLEEAEKVARQAVAIDPSDGEQGKGDRMRVYAVLADIRAARGDQKESDFLRGVIRAIRQSERADDFNSAGLLSRAVKMYQESLTHFTDAYCIQSRLAVQLSTLGQHDLAAQHYEKAFALMPDSFGRVESHCFGCEGTFSDSRAQGVAERVFTTLVAKNPNKPQIHYLLGYLRQQQGRGKDAAPHFQQALKLDRDYLNAWERLEQISQDHRLPASERDAIAFNILRLDPLGRHASASLSTVSDLRGLWQAVETATRFQVRPPSALLVLPASREAVEKREQENKNKRSRFDRHHFSGEGFDRQNRSPGAVLAQHQLLIAIAGLATTAAQLGDGE